MPPSVAGTDPIITIGDFQHGKTFLLNVEDVESLFFSFPLRCIYYVCVSGAWPNGCPSSPLRDYGAGFDTGCATRARACPARVDIY